MRQIKEIWTNGHEAKLVILRVEEVVIAERMLTLEEANELAKTDKTIDVKTKEW